MIIKNYLYLLLLYILSIGILVTSLSNYTREIINCERDAKSKPCIPPYRNVLSRFRVNKKYKMNFCTITKNFSTMIRGILCFLDHPGYAKKYQTPISNTKWTYKYCDDYNFEEKTVDIAKNYTDGSVNKLMKSYTNIVFVREPIERFISGFVDKCLIAKDFIKIDPTYCYGCKTNLKCFVNRFYKRIKEQILFPKRKHTDTFDDTHFYPQTWHCQLNIYRQYYTIIKYGTTTESSKIFYKEFFELLKSKKIPQKQINFIKNGTINKHTPHSTSNKKITSRITNVIKNSPQILEKLIRIFYYDFIEFDYPIPDLPEPTF
uniref:Sulfotransfer_1 domain-containing protein n=1 Tax=Strongyloides papillosus TaxID=174720 RepID=A0A0N5C142_STREA